MTITRPLVIGLGGVGALLASLLRDAGMAVTALDHRVEPQPPDGVACITGDARDGAALAKILKNHDAVISCLPFHLTLAVAQAAHDAGIHYFDPTEDVATTESIVKLAQSARHAMIPQCGLAPGVVGIIGAHIARQFDPSTLRYIRLRCGALPQSPSGQLGYAGNWSLEGLIHEYIADCDVIADGKRQKIPALLGGQYGRHLRESRLRRGAGLRLGLDQAGHARDISRLIEWLGLQQLRHLVAALANGLPQGAVASSARLEDGPHSGALLLRQLLDDRGGGVLRQTGGYSRWKECRRRPQFLAHHGTDKHQIERHRTDQNGAQQARIAQPIGAARHHVGHSVSSSAPSSRSKGRAD